jgi:hypothetical protein
MQQDCRVHPPGGPIIALHHLRCRQALQHCHTPHTFGMATQPEQTASQALSNSVWAFSKLGQEDKALLEAVAVASVPQLSQFNAQNLANLVSQHGCIKQSRSDSSMAHALHICLRAAAVCFSRHVSSSEHDLIRAGVQAWAYANLMFQPPCQLLDHVATAAQRSITKFSPQNTSNLVWCALVAPAHARTARTLVPGTSLQGVVTLVFVPRYCVSSRAMCRVHAQGICTAGACRR